VEVSSIRTGSGHSKRQDTLNNSLMLNASSRQRARQSVVEISTALRPRARLRANAIPFLDQVHHPGRVVAVRRILAISRLSATTRPQAPFR